MINVRSMFGNPNWGDWTFNKELVYWLSGEVPNLINCMSKKSHSAGDYTLAGSVLNFAGNDSISWGTGIIAPAAIPYDRRVEILSVRGLLTKKQLDNCKIPCPSIFGDPGLLVSKMYSPKKTKKYKLGYIPHYIDKDLDCVKKMKANPDTLVIDICSGFKEVLDDICQCEVIASSSLHGLIIAQSYGIPYTWLVLSNSLCGGSWKFKDFFSSCWAYYDKVKYCTQDSSLQDIINMAQFFETPDLDKLLGSCPIYKRSKSNDKRS